MLVVDLVRRCSDINISHLKAKDVEINFTDEKSVFNELLDEIIYYLQSGGYDLVVFEDLDRISKPQKLFLKLREINILLNESAYYIDKGKCIRFLYAIRDDVFEKEVRAKCFDYIIPVIPIVNNFNAGEYLISNYPTELNGISTTDIKRLGLFISSMRELINIMNEYMLYRKTILKESMSPKKLFAIILYKNLFPNDYSLAHTKEGYLFNAFNNKHYFSDQFTKEPKEELNSTAIVIQNERDAITILRERVLGCFNEEGITSLVINGRPYSLSKIAESDALFSNFRNDKVESWIIDSGPVPEVGNYKYTFKELLSKSGQSSTFDDEIDSHELTIKKHTEIKVSLR